MCASARVFVFTLKYCCASVGRGSVRVCLQKSAYATRNQGRVHRSPRMFAFNHFYRRRCEGGMCYVRCLGKKSSVKKFCSLARTFLKRFQHQIWRCCFLPLCDYFHILKLRRAPSFGDFAVAVIRIFGYSHSFPATRTLARHISDTVSVSRMRAAILFLLITN